VSELDAHAATQGLDKIKEAQDLAEAKIKEAQALAEAKVKEAQEAAKEAQVASPGPLCTPSLPPSLPLFTELARPPFTSLPAFSLLSFRALPPSLSSPPVFVSESVIAVRFSS
jgi:hypothetical protein